MRLSDDEFLTLLRSEQSRLMRIARALTGQEADAWDLLQEATLVAYDRIGELRGTTASFAPWIRRILVNRARNLLRRRNRTVLVDLAEREPEADPAPGPEELLARSQLWELVMQLEEHHRQVLVLRFLVDLPVEEIGDLLGVAAGTVKSRIHRGLAALRRQLLEEEKGVAIQR